VDKLITALRARGLTVAVLAVDPSSPFTGGAILGDRLRMNDHATDDGVFIRSLASRGRLGGITGATMSAARAMDAAGYDMILVETVGVGQSEVEIVEVADTVVLVAVPGLGDDIQVNKAGVMEIGDLFVVNKADRDGADRVVREIRTMLETAAALKRNSLSDIAPVDTLIGHHGLGHDFDLAAHLALGPKEGGLADGALGPPAPRDQAMAGFATPPVVKTVAETGEGVEALLDLIIAHYEGQKSSGALELRRLKGARRELRNLIHAGLDRALAGEGLASLEEELASALARGGIDAQGAAESLAQALKKGGY
jgi:LAO/AO transport system kinase